MKLTKHELGQMLASAYSSGGLTAIANEWGFDDRDKLDDTGVEYAKMILRARTIAEDAPGNGGGGARREGS